MIAPDRDKLKLALNGSKFEKINKHITDLLDEKYANPRHGHFNDWREILESLPLHKASQSDFSCDEITIGQEGDISAQQKESLEKKLKELCPWRKGPINIFGVHIDAEWLSDWKWSRVAPYIDLKDEYVMDIGCGNGYYSLRMQGMAAKLVLGIDPSWHYVFQFHTLQKYSSIEQKSFVLPFSLEEFPESHNTFDTIFSMGVLYHRQEPHIHLEQIHSLLTTGGQLILETLIIEDENADILIPNERYANMRNVWMIPNINLLKRWLTESGFENINVVDITMTTIEEQRQTEWMTRYSLNQALNPDDPSLTIEGYQAPLRCMVIADKEA